jgi:hypothetical protein
MIVRPQTLPHQRVGWRLKGEEVRYTQIKTAEEVLRDIK